MYQNPGKGTRKYFSISSPFPAGINPSPSLAVNTVIMSSHQHSRLSISTLFLMAFGIPLLEAFALQKLADLNYFLSPVKLFPAAGAYGLLILALKDRIQISFSRTRLVVHLFCLFLFLAGSIHSSGLPFWYGAASQAPLLHYAAIYILCTVLMVSGAFLWINPFLYYRASRPAFLFAFLAGTSRLGYDLLNPVLWKSLAQVYIPLLVGSLNALGFEVSRGLSSRVISHPSLVVRIDPGCSGLDGVFFFIGVFSALMIFDFQKFLREDFLKIFAVGSALMLIMNYFRLGAFLIYGYSLAGELSREKGGSAMLQLFHSNVGWLLYSAGILGWTFWVYRKLGGKADENASAVVPAVKKPADKKSTAG